jgi:hypothetical protein
MPIRLMETRTLEEARFSTRGVLAEKWGSALTAGFQVIPNVLFRAQSRLKLDSVDCMILLNLNLHWWEKDNLPYPPPALIAQRMGVSRRTIERRSHRLQKTGWLKRLPATANDDRQPKIRKYDLSGTVEKLQEAAIIGLSQRDYRAKHPGRSRSRPLPGTRPPKQLLLGSG